MRHQEIDQWSQLALARFLLASVVAIDHLAAHAPLGVLSLVKNFGSFEAILGFLLISGYSVTSSYLANKEGFFARRIARIYPIYLGSIMITLFVGFCVQGKELPSMLDLTLNALFLNQLFTRTSFVGPAWSLSLEVWLYCLLPIFLASGLKVNRVLIYISFSAYLIYTCLRTLLHQPHYAGVGYGLNLLFLGFAWLLGSSLARQTQPNPAALRDLALILSIHFATTIIIQFGYRIRRDTIGLFSLQTHQLMYFRR